MNIKDSFYKILLMTFLILFSGINAQSVKTVKYDNTSSLRQIAKKYLNDSNLWEEILKVNGLKSITELKNGMVLKLPEDVITISEKEIADALELIQQATAAGARLFTPELINQAIDFRNKAIEQRLIKNWQEAIKFAKESQRTAKSAISESKNKNDVSVEAVLSDRSGTVQDKLEDGLLWDDTPLLSALNENQKIRTLSESFAEISFKDESRLRLNSNSQAVIQKMRMNLIENKQESEVSLLEGDIYALLSGSPRRKMNIDVPGVDTEINSKKFWINNTAGDIKVANYDGEIKLKTTQSSLTLEKNKGTMLGPDGKPMKPTDLLPKPDLKFPNHNTVYYKSGKNNSVVFEWNKIEGAVNYWLEIGYERSSFSKTVLSRPNVKENKIEISGFDVDGAYYWRVAAIDKYGFPGNTSDASLVKVITDTTKPYLYLHSPTEHQMFTNDKISIRGETEVNVTLHINGASITTDDNGAFSYDTILTRGDNLFRLDVTDVAGNNYSMSRTVSYQPLDEVKLNIRKSLPSSVDGKIEIPSSGGIISGKVLPRAKIKMFSDGSNYFAKSVSDSSGNYSLSVPDKLFNRSINFSVEALNGVGQEDEYKIDSPVSIPKVTLKNNLPEKTRESNLVANLLLHNIDTLRINNDYVAVSAGELDYPLALTEGKNIFIFEGYNTYGDRSVSVKSITLDTTPPEFIDEEIIKTKDDPHRITIHVKYKDKADMARIAEYKLTAGDQKFNGYLVLNQELSIYEGKLYIPGNSVTNTKLNSILLKDTFGNSKYYEF